MSGCSSKASPFYYDEDYAKAIEVLERLVKTYPGHTSGHSWLAIAYCYAGDIDKAIEQQEIAVQNLRTPTTVWNLANYYMA